MSRTPTPTTSTSNYQSIFDNALEVYKKKTKKDLRSHPLLQKLESCHSPDAVVNVLREHISEFNQSRDDDKLNKWLNPIVKVLSAFSATIGGGVSLVYSPAGVIFTGIAVLLSAYQAVSTSEDALANVFGCMENFFIRLDTYIEIPPTKGMTDIIVKIMTEMLSILGIATMEIKRSRARKYLKKLFGNTNIEDALARLDRLTQEEVRMAAAQTLIVTHEVDNKVQAVDNKVQGVNDKVQGVDDKVRGIDDNIQRVDDRVQGVGDNVRDIGGKMDVLIDGGEVLKEEIQQVADDVGDQKRNQIQRDLEKWLSPPDPSVNFNTASDAHHKGTAIWFTGSDDFKNWKASGSFLWIYGKPGSGKSVLSSSVIKDVEGKEKEKGNSNTRSAYIAYFFFDFKDIRKQDAHALLSSLVFQLSHQSDSFLHILCRYYSTHQSGSQKPSDRALTQCLEEMFRVPGQIPIYLIVDGLDESPNTTGLPSSRDKVLAFVEKLVELNLPNLRLCITSRPEVDIRSSLGHLATIRISLHDQSGQKKDIIDFIKSVVYSNRNMRRWREEDRVLVIKTLSERADGMFRWVFCQLETLRHCLPPSVLRILGELPVTLDKTYERILEEIPMSNRVHAHRLLQCLTVAVRPLRVEELAEVVAIDFEATGGIPKLKEDWRWESQEQAVLSACSSLIAVVEDNDSRVVQFSHFSVKEFLTSGRLATSIVDASRYHHILLEPAHTIMAQACLSVLLRLDRRFYEDGIGEFPLARYATAYFGNHAEFNNVLSQILGGIDDLLDAKKPHFVAWMSGLRGYLWSPRPKVAPLYYVAELGFRGMVQHLISKRLEDLDSDGEDGTPLHAALMYGHADVAQLLVRHCVDVNARGTAAQTPLHLAGYMGHLEIVRMLIERNADINARNYYGQTPLYQTARGNPVAGDDRHFNVARFLLSHGAEPDAMGNDHSTALHAASYWGHVKVAQLLLEHGANIDAQDSEGQTPLHGILDNWDGGKPDRRFDFVRLLVERGADVDAQDNDNSTPLHEISYHGFVKAAQLLLEHGANIDMRNKSGQTPLHRAVDGWNDRIDDYFDVIRLLVEHGADVHAQDNDNSTPLHGVSHHGSVKAAQLLLEHGANIDARDKSGQTPLRRAIDGWDGDMADDYFDALVERGADVRAQDNDNETLLHAASYRGLVKAAQLLLEHGANIDVRNKSGQTPMHRVVDGWKNDKADKYCDTLRLLAELGADVHAQDNHGSTPLHGVLYNGSAKAAQLLLEHGANLDARDMSGETPLHRAIYGWINDRADNYCDALRLLLERGADIDAQDNYNSTPLHAASYYGSVKAAQLLLEHGANINVRTKSGRTVLHQVVAGRNYGVDKAAEYFDALRLLVEHGADVHAQDEDNSTPLHNVSCHGSVKAAQLLLEHGANVDARDKRGRTLLHRVVENWDCNLKIPDYYIDLIYLLVERGADIDPLDIGHSTPLLVTSYNGCVKAARVLLEHGANVHLQNNRGKTAFQIASMGGHEEFTRLLSEHLEDEKKQTYGGILPGRGKAEEHACASRFTSEGSKFSVPLPEE